jgi:hypothetical protein
MPIHIAKNGPKSKFLSKNGLYICEFKIHGQKNDGTYLYNANNEGNLYTISLGEHADLRKNA